MNFLRSAIYIGWGTLFAFCPVTWADNTFFKILESIKQQAEGKTLEIKTLLEINIRVRLGLIPAETKEHSEALEILEKFNRHHVHILLVPCFSQLTSNKNRTDALILKNKLNQLNKNGWLTKGQYCGFSQFIDEIKANREAIDSPPQNDPLDPLQDHPIVRTPPDTLRTTTPSIEETPAGHPLSPPISTPPSPAAGGWFSWMPSIWGNS